MIIVKTSSKGQIILPKTIRKSLNIKPGQKLTLRVVGDHAEIKPLPTDPIEYLCGIFKDYPSSLAEELLTERQKDKNREEIAIARCSCGPVLPETGKRLRTS